MYLNLFLILLNYSIPKEQSSDPPTPPMPPIGLPSIMSSSPIPPTSPNSIHKSIYILENNGEDMREIENDNSKFPIQTIIENHQKSEWLKTLKHSDYSDEEKIDFIKKEIDYDYSIFSIKAGGLLRDW